jgi:hypothetical protein
MDHNADAFTQPTLPGQSWNSRGLTPDTSNPSHTTSATHPVSDKTGQDAASTADTIESKATSERDDDVPPAKETDLLQTILSQGVDSVCNDQHGHRIELRDGTIASGINILVDQCIKNAFSISCGIYATGHLDTSRAEEPPIKVEISGSSLIEVYFKAPDKATAGESYHFSPGSMGAMLVGRQSKKSLAENFKEVVSRPDSVLMLIDMITYPNDGAVWALCEHFLEEGRLVVGYIDPSKTQ